MKNKTVLFVTQAALIAALYVVLTMLANALGLASQTIQVRFSEALTILPLFTPAAIPGLFIGCLLANLLTGAHILDVIFGSLATLIAAAGTYLIGRNAAPSQMKVRKWFAPLPPIIANVLVVPPILFYVYQLEGTIPFFMLTVGIGEIISCGILGILLYLGLAPHRQTLFPSNHYKQ